LLPAFLPNMLGRGAASQLATLVTVPSGLVTTGSALIRAWPFLLFQKRMPAVCPFCTGPLPPGGSPKL
jgi:hypothetical protein